MPAVTDRPEWDAFVAAHPQGHILQTSAWGELKTAFGWHAETVRVQGAGALILFRPLPLGLGTIAYIPKGPLVDWDDPNSLAALLPSVDSVCRSRRAACLKIEPDISLTSDRQGLTSLPGFRPSHHAVQPRRTLIVDLAGDEQTILTAMKQKCRYNIGLAKKKGVTVRVSDDLAAFNALMQTTGARDNFYVHAPAYYEKAYALFHARDMCELLLAEHEGRWLAGLIVFALGRRAWYFYGGSSDAERSRMPTYLLQWEAMRWAKAKGCVAYDLWGVPDEDEAALEANFEARRDVLWGVYRFKRGFGGTLVRSVGAWDRVYSPALYHVYRMAMKTDR